jgi:hypothetical protein
MTNSTPIHDVDATLTEMDQLAGELAGLYGDLTDVTMTAAQREGLSARVADLDATATPLRQLAGHPPGQTARKRGCCTPPFPHQDSVRTYPPTAAGARQSHR